MAAHFSHHTVITLADAAGTAPAALPVKVEELGNASFMTLQSFSIAQVLQQGTVLVASAGQVRPLRTYQKHTKHRCAVLHGTSCCTGV